MTLRVQPAAGDERLVDPDGPSDGADPGSLDIAAASSADVGELHRLHPCGFCGLRRRRWPAARRSGADGYATRDLGRLYPDGSVDVLGRLDHATKRDGRLVMLAEVERALCALPAVERAAVLLGPPTLRGADPVGLCRPRPGAELEASSVLRQCQARLPSFAVPDDLRVLSALPPYPAASWIVRPCSASCLPRSFCTSSHGEPSWTWTRHHASTQPQPRPRRGQPRCSAPLSPAAVLPELRRMLLVDLKLGLDRAALRADVPLLEGGLGLDSITLFELITLVERRYGLSFPPER